MPDKNPIACLLVIGNEVPSGRTQDANIRFIAKGLGERGIPLREVPVIPDVPATIIGTVNEVRAMFDYVFTTGGIGPTHDDITSECVAAAFGGAVGAASAMPGLGWSAATSRVSSTRHAAHGNDAARATSIDNAMSVAPGFQIGNVYVMAGVPRVMQSMFEWLAPRLKGGAPVVSCAVHVVGLPEGIIAGPLGAVQASFPSSISAATRSTGPGGNGVAIVAKGTRRGGRAGGYRRGDGDHRGVRQGADTR